MRWLAELERALPGRVIVDEDALERVSRDESELGPFRPQALVLAKGVEDVSKTLSLAEELGFPVYPRGAGTSLVGGPLPVKGGVVLELASMDDVLEFPADDLYVLVEPGVITGQLQALVEEEGLFYPPDPASLDSCTIGGNVATNAGGPRALKYGVTANWVLGLEVVLPGGQVRWFGRRTKKGVTGYELHKLFVGSEGTLGVITKVALGLIPKPPAVATALALFEDERKAARGVWEVLRRGVLPRTLEFLDLECLEALGRFGEPGQWGAAIILETDGSPEEAWAQLERAGEILEGLGMAEIRVAENEAQRRRVWERRRLLAPTLEELWGGVDDDVCVPRSKVPEAVEGVRRIAQRLGCRAAVFGHAGDGNLHLHIKCEDPKALRQFRESLYRLALSLGGSITGEHGVGLLKKGFASLEIKDPAPFLKLKALFDPKGVMNPGKWPI